MQSFIDKVVTLRDYSRHKVLTAYKTGNVSDRHMFRLKDIESGVVWSRVYRENGDAWINREHDIMSVDT